MDEDNRKKKGRRPKDAFDPAVSNVTHNFTIAKDKYQSGQFAECYSFCEKAIQIGKENVVNLDLMIDVLALKRQMITMLNPRDFRSQITQLMALAEDFYNLKGKETDQYARCFGELRKPIFQVALLPGSKIHQQKLILQGKALRRIFEVEEKPWQEYTEETKKYFMDWLAFRINFSHPMDPLLNSWLYVIFMMMDVHGIGMVNIWDAQQMIRDLKILKYSGPDGLVHAIYDLINNKEFQD